MYHQSAFAKLCMREEVQFEHQKEKNSLKARDTMNYAEMKKGCSLRKRTGNDDDDIKDVEEPGLITILLVGKVESAWYALILWSDGTNVQDVSKTDGEFLHEYHDAVRREGYNKCGKCSDERNIAHINWHDVFRR